MPTENSPVRIIKDSATSPTRPVGPLRRSATVEVTISTPTAPPPTPADSDPRSNLGPGAIFSNSAVCYFKLIFCLSLFVKLFKLMV